MQDKKGTCKQAKVSYFSNPHGGHNHARVWKIMASKSSALWIHEVNKLQITAMKDIHNESMSIVQS